MHCGTSALLWHFTETWPMVALVMALQGKLPSTSQRRSDSRRLRP